MNHSGHGLGRFPSAGATLDSGRIVVEQRLRGRLWSGTAGGQPVVLVHKDIQYTKHREALDQLFRFDAPGIAKLEFLGYPDDGSREVALVEARPEGMEISALEPLTLAEAAQCGIGLCEAVLAWGERGKSLIAGIRPESVYMACGSYAGVTPRVAYLAGDADGITFGGPRYEAPSAGSPIDTNVDDVGFIIAQVLWFALLHEHPYKLLDAPDESQNIWHDRRRRFTGPPEMGRVLEAVLVADPGRRLSVRGFRDQLARLAAG